MRANAPSTCSASLFVVKPEPAFLWLGPLFFLARGGWLAFGRFRRGEGDAEDAA